MAEQPPDRPVDGALANEQLLFGIIALQNDFITREQLVAGFDAWVHDKSRGLADVLTSQCGDEVFVQRWNTGETAIRQSAVKSPASGSDLSRRGPARGRSVPKVDNARSSRPVATLNMREIHRGAV